MSNADLNSVNNRIGQAIILFYERRLAVNMPQFYADDLRQFVEAAVGKIAPGSADRILRDKRQNKQLNYVVINRAKSLYKFLPVFEAGVVGIITPIIIEQKAELVAA